MIQEKYFFLKIDKQYKYFNDIIYKLHHIFIHFPIISESYEKQDHIIILYICSNENQINIYEMLKNSNYKVLYNNNYIIHENDIMN